MTTALIGLDEFEVLAAADTGGELELVIETTADLVGCPGCGAVARPKDRRKLVKTRYSAHAYPRSVRFMPSCRRHRSVLRQDRRAELANG